MALRVLLADESTTIKKVMQLALQDFAVEVKAVPVGVDVVEVARTYKPDIIFADVLLPKRNGYDVCGDLKKDPQLGQIPVVLMWSSFMELDEALATQVQADGRLEKPFDVESLRQRVLELVPLTRSQRLAHFLKFPESTTQPLKSEEAQRRESGVTSKAPASNAAGVSTPTADSSPAATASGPATPSVKPPPIPPPPPLSTKVPVDSPTSSAAPPPVPPPQTSRNSTWSMESFEDIGQFATPERAQPDVDESDEEGFSEFKLTNLTAPGAKALRPSSGQTRSGANPDDQEPWSHQDLSRFKLDLPPVSVESPEFDLNFDIEDNEVTESGLRSSRTQPEPRGEDKPFEMTEFAPPEEELNFEVEEDEHGAETSLGIEEPTYLEPMPMPMRLEEPASHSSVDRSHDLSHDHEELTLEGGIPQLSAERLEEIIRSQSREIIETVVRRVVPDLATDIIRKELQRLLEDPQDRQTISRAMSGNTGSTKNPSGSSPGTPSASSTKETRR